MINMGKSTGNKHSLCSLQTTGPAWQCHTAGQHQPAPTQDPAMPLVKALKSQLGHRLSQGHSSPRHSVTSSKASLLYYFTTQY